MTAADAGTGKVCVRRRLVLLTDPVDGGRKAVGRLTGARRMRLVARASRRPATGGVAFATVSSENCKARADRGRDGDGSASIVSWLA